MQRKLQKQYKKQYKPLTLKKPFYEDPGCYRKFALGLFAFLTAYVAASLLAPVQISDATDSGNQIIDVNNTNTGYYVSVSGASTLNVSTTTTPSGSLFGATDTLTTTTNSPRGYQLYISASPNYLYLNGDQGTSSQGKFSPIGGDLTSAIALGSNTWGFAFDNAATGVTENNFAAASVYVPEGSASSSDDTIIPGAAAVYTSVPTTATMIQSIDAANEPNGTKLPIYYGFKVNTSLPSGSYQGAVTYTVISDGVNNNATYMQDFTTEMCNNLTAATAENYSSVKVDLIDKRDMKWYSVAKMKDGNCWMTQNLALDGMDSSGAVRTLTPDDSDVTQNRTLAANIEGKGATIDDADADSIQIYSGWAEDATSSCSYTYCVTSDSLYGNHYNWKAVTAGTGTTGTTGTAFESVCPKGWRLPDNGTTSGQKTYSNLFSSYSLPTANVTDGSAVQAIQKPPFNFPLAGSFESSRARRGLYWSRTSVSGAATNAYLLRVDSNDGSFNPQNINSKAYGFSVRCVFEGDTIQNNMFMQDINLTMCSNLAESTSSSDNRRTVVDARDSKTYRVSHLADGNCWMVQNLALDGGRTLQPTDSNVTKSRTLNPNISSGTMTADRDYIYSGKATSYTSSCSASYPDCVVSTEPYGNHYNWIAATATVGTASSSDSVYESVCPLNWRLPDNGVATGAKTYSNLVGAYNLPTTNIKNGSAVQAIQRSPLNFPLTGTYHNSVVNTANDAHYWSRMPIDSANAYILLFDSDVSNFYSQSSGAKFYGFSVRCVLGE